ncbi:hypothetical protein BD309DRAFT_295959 [Dichomitus squalens]|uniref:Uncharacterized protein n=1 Tax=Dichomitus squalens TaxID=114155 RepID=A0A4V6MWI0_9APHY|nr:hypothetical protein BD309DRAFT_295959 [Dichomitus squalens]TBU58735.1 hypothetical protein BD310DRAFT_448981 [Dichomitus squalens]
MSHRERALLPFARSTPRNTTTPAGLVGRMRMRLVSVLSWTHPIPAPAMNFDRDRGGPLCLVWQSGHAEATPWAAILGSQYRTTSLQPTCHIGDRILAPRVQPTPEHIASWPMCAVRHNHTLLRGIEALSTFSSRFYCCLEVPMASTQVPSCSSITVCKARKELRASLHCARLWRTSCSILLP